MEAYACRYAYFPLTQMGISDKNELQNNRGLKFIQLLIFVEC